VQHFIQPPEVLLFSDEDLKIIAATYAYHLNSEVDSSSSNIIYKYTISGALLGDHSRGGYPSEK
jgi:hypothetical protein